MACAYVIAQCLGAFMGYGLLIVLTPIHVIESSGTSVCVTKPHPDLTFIQAFFIEFVATGVLIWFCCSIWDPRNAKSHDSVAIRFAFAITGLASATVSILGCIDYSKLYIDGAIFHVFWLCYCIRIHGNCFTSNSNLTQEILRLCRKTLISTS